MVRSFLARRPARYTQVGALVLLVPVAVALLVWSHVVVGSALVSAAVAGGQRIGASASTGVLTETHLVVLRGRGSRQPICLGSFDSADGRYVGHQVRVYARPAACDDLVGSAATLLPGVADGLNTLISPPASRTRLPLRLGVTFGVLDGAWVGDTGTFVKSLWPLLVITPLMVVLPDGALISLLRDRRRRRSGTADRPTPPSPSV